VSSNSVASESVTRHPSDHWKTSARVNLRPRGPHWRPVTSSCHIRDRRRSGGAGSTTHGVQITWCASRRVLEPRALLLKVGLCRETLRTTSEHVVKRIYEAPLSFHHQGMTCAVPPFSPERGGIGPRAVGDGTHSRRDPPDSGRAMGGLVARRDEMRSATGAPWKPWAAGSCGRGRRLEGWASGARA
jgi:hypothetical protein